jgi:phosphinothricin acetyltransferase
MNGDKASAPTPQACTIRIATRDDVPGILDIYNEAVLNTTATYDYDPATLEQRLLWFDEHARDGYPIFVAQDDMGRIVGWSSLSRFHNRVGYKFTTENSVYVAAGHRGRGVGKRLMPPLIQGARELGLHAIIAGIDAENPASIRLHAQFDFAKVAHLKRVGFKFNRWLDVIYMERLLDD